MGELISSNHDADAHAISTTLRKFFDAYHFSPPPDKWKRNLPWGHDRKFNFHANAEPLVNPEVKAATRNISCPSQDRLELLEVSLGPDFNLEG